MILDDEALVERVARAIGAIRMWDGDTFAHFHTREELTSAAQTAIEAVRVHMWDDGK